MNNSPFKSYAVSLHRDLLDRLVLLCQQKESALEQKLHAAVIACEDSIETLYEVMPKEFVSIEEDILFFKSIKPLFTIEKEYHQRLYHARIWEDDHFCGRELQRMEKLLTSNNEFADYYHGGHTYNDLAWFTQGQAPLPTPLCVSVWETNPRHTSARDGWVAGLLAVERYVGWLKCKAGMK